MKKIFTAAITTIVLCSSMQAQSVDQIKQTIRTVMDQQIAGWNSGDIQSFMQGYMKFDSLRFASGGNVTYGWNNMLQRYKKNYSTKEKMGQLTFGNITINVLSADAAMVFGKWSLKRDKDEPWGLFTLLFRNKNGEWRIIHDHTSSGN